jgi:hypothetical protein
MSTPIVTEITRRSEPVARDTFIDEMTRPTADPAPRPASGSRLS